MIWLCCGPVPASATCVPCAGRAPAARVNDRPRESGKETRMLKSAILLLAVFTFCALAAVGCKAEGEVGKTASSIGAAR